MESGTSTSKESDGVRPPPGTEVLRTRTAEIWIGSDGILRVVSLQGAVHGAAEARENLAAIPVEQKRMRPLLVDMRRIGAIKREAREIYRSPGKNSNSSAMALLIESALSKAIGNFFIGLSKMHIPTRLFTDPARALDWLRGYLDSSAAPGS